MLTLRIPRLLAKLAVLGLLLSAWITPLSAQAEDPCLDPNGSLSDYTTTLQDSPEAVTSNVKRGILDELAARATSDGLTGGGRLDLLRRAFVALDLGTIKEEEGQLVFNFNPEALKLDSLGQFSPRVIVHEPALFGALDKNIDTLDETVRQGLRDTLKKGIGDLDDVEIKVRWTPRSQEPATDLQEVASQLYDFVDKDTIAGPIADAKAEIIAILKPANPGFFGEGVPLSDVCRNGQAKEVLLDIPHRIVQDANSRLEARLKKTAFFALADLIDGEPRFVFDGSSRRRSGAAGPDEYSLNVTWQVGAISYRGAKRFALDQGKARIDAESVNDYFKANGRLEGALPLFSLSASYSEVDSFEILYPGRTDSFSQERSHKLSALLTAGAYFGGGRDRRLELSASYDDVTDDPALNDRFVAKLSWVEQLSPAVAQALGGSEFVATLIYANKPEFLDDDLQKEFGMRAGLKWSLGKKKDS